MTIKRQFRWGKLLAYVLYTHVIVGGTGIRKSTLDVTCYKLLHENVTLPKNTSVYAYDFPMHAGRLKKYP